MFPRSGPSNFVLLFADFTKEVQAKLEWGCSRLRRVEEDIERAHEREHESHEKQKQDGKETNTTIACIPEATIT